MSNAISGYGSYLHFAGTLAGSVKAVQLEAAFL
jgi:hypothetical protein